MVHLRSVIHILRQEALWIVLGVMVLLLVQAGPIAAADQSRAIPRSTAGAPDQPVGPGLRTKQTLSHSGENAACSVPVDVAIVFDRTLSMVFPNPSKLSNARAAALNFVNTFAGGSGATTFGANKMALVGFHDSTATVDASLSNSATAMRNALGSSSYSFGSGFTNIGRGLQMGQLELNSDVNAVPKYIILLSDGGANRPSNITTSGVDGDFYIDVNDNGYIDSGDDIDVLWNSPSTTKRFRVVDGLLQISRGGSSSTRQTNVMNLMDVNHNNQLDDGDNATFTPPLSLANFRIISGTLYLASTRNPPPGGTPIFRPAPDPNNFSSGHDDDLTVLRNGDVWAGSVSFDGDGSDVYARYWANQAKKAGTFIYVIGYELEGNDQELNEAMASPGGYFNANTANISDIFNQISQRICGISINKTHTGSSVIQVGSAVSFTLTLKNTGTANLSNVTITDTYPVSLTYSSANPAPTSVNVPARTLVWQNLAPTTWTPGTSASIVITLTATTPGISQNCATVSALKPGSVAILNGPSCASVSAVQPTAVTLSSFKGGVNGKKVRLKWATGTEIGLLGFNVWRKKGAADWKRVNDELVPAKNIGSLNGANYTYVDTTARAGKRYRYKLEVVGPNGTLEWSSVVRVKVPK